MRHPACIASVPGVAAGFLLAALVQPATARAQDAPHGATTVVTPAPSSPAAMGAPEPLPANSASTAPPTRATLDAIAPGMGRLRVLVNRPDTRVTIDDRDEGIAPVERDLPAGHHRVRVSSPGEKSWEGDVDVAAGMLTPLRATLRPSPSRSTAVAITVFSAAVLTGGAVMGVLSNQERSALDADRSAGLLDDHDPRIDRGQVYAGIADGAFVVSALIGAIAVYLFAHDASPPSEARPGRRRALRVSAP